MTARLSASRPRDVGAGRGRYVLATLVLGVGCETVHTLVGQLSRARPWADASLVLDRAVPLVPAAVWAYQAWVPLLLLPAVLLRDPRRVHRTLLAGLGACLSAYVMFLVVPIDVPRPALGDGLAERVLAGVYAVDRLHGGAYCPSLHVATATIVALSFAGGASSRRLALGVGLLAASVSVSTVLTKQHVVIDVAAGLVWGWGWWYGSGPALDAVAGRDAGPAASWGRLRAFAVRVTVVVVVLAILAPAAAWAIAGLFRPADAPVARAFAGPASVWGPLAAAGTTAALLGVGCGRNAAAVPGLMTLLAAVAIADGETWRAAVAAPVYGLLLWGAVRLRSASRAPSGVGTRPNPLRP